MAKLIKLEVEPWEYSRIKAGFQPYMIFPDIPDYVSQGDTLWIYLKGTMQKAPEGRRISAFVLAGALRNYDGTVAGLKTGYMIATLKDAREIGEE